MRDPDTDDVKTQVFAAGVAAAVTKKPRHRIIGTGRQRLTQYIQFRFHTYILDDVAKSASGEATGLKFKSTLRPF